mgnify:CR=1 FL=1
MNDKTKTINATQAMTDRAMTGLFSRAFAQPLKPGDRLVFTDMAHYTMVKNIRDFKYLDQ